MKLELTWFPSELGVQTFTLRIFSGIFQFFFFLRTCEVECSDESLAWTHYVEQNNSVRLHLESTNMLQRRNSEYK